MQVRNFAVGSVTLILLILKFKFQPFIALLISSILVGVLAWLSNYTASYITSRSHGEVKKYLIVGLGNIGTGSFVFPQRLDLDHGPTMKP